MNKKITQTNTENMKKYIIIFLLTIFQMSISYGQIDDIKKKGNEHNNQTNPGNNDTNTDNNDSESCFSPCFNFCVSSSCIFIGSILDEWHKNILDNKAEDPTIVSLEVMPQVGLNNDLMTYHIMPRIRGTWGLYSTDFRYNFIVENSPGKLQFLRSLNWVIAEMNLISINEFNLRVGTGWFAHETTDNTFFHYNEQFVGIELRTFDQKINYTIEGRSAWDYTFGGNVYHEIGFKGSARVFEIPKVSLYVTIGANYYNYYTSVDFMTSNIGLNFLIH